MATITPTLSAQRWGEEVYAFFDYYRNPVRVGVDAAHPNGQNPCLFVRHGGGGTGGDYKNQTTSAYGDAFYFPAWMIGTHAATNPAARWDMCCFESGQAYHSDFFTGTQTTLFPRSRALYFPDTIRDAQRAIAAITRLHVQLGFNPNRKVLYGESFGAVMAMLTQLVPPIGGPGRRSVWRRGTFEPDTHDSTVRAVLFAQGQIDCRKIAGVDYMNFANFGGWFGTRTDNSAEFDALPDSVRAMASIRAYLEANELDGAVPTFVANVVQGDHNHPFTNPHDSAQHADLTAALSAAGVTYGEQLRNAGEWENTNWPNDPPAPVLARYQAVEAFLSTHSAP